MGSDPRPDLSPVDGETNQGRREALLKFGRFAAAAPAAMLLLQPRDSFAGKRKGRYKRRKVRRKGQGWRY